MAKALSDPRGSHTRWDWFVYLLGIGKIRLNKAFCYADTPCWEWLGYRNKKGYGQMYYNGRGSHTSHRWMFETFRGALGSLVPDHQCPNKWCVNPWHCEPATLEHNSSRANKRLVCKRGHLLTEENRYENQKRHGCKICARQRASDWYYKRRYRKTGEVLP